MLLKYLGAAIAIGLLGYGVISLASEDNAAQLPYQGIDVPEISTTGEKKAADSGRENATPSEPKTKQKKQVATARPKSADSAKPAVSVSIVDLDSLKDSYRNLADDEIVREIKDLEAGIEQADLIARANQSDLSASEMQDLSDRLQNLDALRLVKLERKLKQINARIKAKPVILDDELP